MISEQICLEILRALHGRSSFYKEETNVDDPAGPRTRQSEEKHALPDGSLVRPLLAKYELADVDASIRWLQLGDYLGRTQWGLGGLWVHKLTPKGVQAAEQGAFPDDDRRMFYREEPHHVFLAHQFRSEDTGLEAALRTAFAARGYTVVDGKVDGLEQFRQAILTKISRARFFCCLLTQRSKLVSGGAVSSVWLYQEIGAAVALRKSPLLFVEDGMDPHYAGELQKTYEYIPFARNGFASVVDEAVTRCDTDLQRSAIPLPRRD